MFVIEFLLVRFLGLFTALPPLARTSLENVRKLCGFVLVKWMLLRNAAIAMRIAVTKQYGGNEFSDLLTENFPKEEIFRT
jgi:hypothetical protein